MRTWSNDDDDDDDDDDYYYYHDYSCLDKSFTPDIDLATEVWKSELIKWGEREGEGKKDLPFWKIAEEFEKHNCCS